MDTAVCVGGGGGGGWMHNSTFSVVRVDVQAWSSSGRRYCSYICGAWAPPSGSMLAARLGTHARPPGRPAAIAGGAFGPAPSGDLPPVEIAPAPNSQSLAAAPISKRSGLFLKGRWRAVDGCARFAVLGWADARALARISRRPCNMFTSRHSHVTVLQLLLPITASSEMGWGGGGCRRSATRCCRHPASASRQHAYTAATASTRLGVHVHVHA